jgi:hypothetical protein
MTIFPQDQGAENMNTNRWREKSGADALSQQLNSLALRLADVPCDSGTHCMYYRRASKRILHYDLTANRSKAEGDGRIEISAVVSGVRSAP